MTDLKTKKIDKSLADSSKTIDALHAILAEESTKAPKNTAKVEARLSEIQSELDSMSEKMLAYKLKRIADSKMLASASDVVKKNKSALPSEHDESSTKKPWEVPKYNSSTFQCRSDLDKCLISSNKPLDRAVCYALFIRCAIKG